MKISVITIFPGYLDPLRESLLGKAIGRGGRTATALRTVMSAVGGRGIRVDVVDTDR